MSIRFAYPNIRLPKGRATGGPLTPEFIGCGRFAVLDHVVEIEEGYHSLPNGANTPNKGQLDAIISRISPSSFDASNSIYEIRDEEEETYKGSSMDLAWFLVNIHRAHALQKWLESISGDIWCTGAIDKSGDMPMISRVEAQWFSIKLDAFLSAENKDHLFIVPAPNLVSEHEGSIRRNGAHKLTLDECLQSSPKLGEDVKTVITVRPDQLADLASLLFRLKPADISIRWRKWTGISLAVLTTFAVLIWLRSSPPPESIRSLLENGRFGDARTAISQGRGESDEDFAAIRSILGSTLSLSVQVEVWKSDQKLPNILSATEVSPGNLVLTSKDNYRIGISADNVQYPVYLYFFQEDSAGDMSIAFPNSKWNQERDNPLDTREFPFAIPSHSRNKWFYLDEVSGNQDLRPTIETIYLIASPWPANDILSSFGELKKATGADRKARLVDLIQRLQLRKSVGIPSVFYQEISFGHGQ